LISPEERFEVVQAMLGIIRTSPVERNQIAAARVLIAADTVNVGILRADVPNVTQNNIVNVWRPALAGVSGDDLAALERLARRISGDETYALGAERIPCDTQPPSAGEDSASEGGNVSHGDDSSQPESKT